MRFVIIIGLSLVARAICEDVIDQHAVFLAMIAVLSLAADVADCYVRWFAKK